MIGAFARKFNAGARVHQVDEGPEPAVTTQEAGKLDETTSLQEPLPQQFVERVPTEAGDVVATPFLDRMRTWAKRVRRGED